MKKIEALSKFKIENTKNGLSNIFGGRGTPTGTASDPQTTMTGSTKCSDSQVNYDDDGGKSTGSCTNYSCI